MVKAALISANPLLAGLPPSSAGPSSLAQAIHNVVSNSGGATVLTSAGHLASTPGIRPVNPASPAFLSSIQLPGMRGPPPGYDPSRPPPLMGLDPRNQPSSPTTPPSAGRPVNGADPRVAAHQENSIPDRKMGIVLEWAKKMQQDSAGKKSGDPPTPEGMLGLNNENPFAQVQNMMGDTDERILPGPGGPGGLAISRMPGVGGQLPSPGAVRAPGATGNRMMLAGPNLQIGGLPNQQGGPGIPGEFCSLSSHTEYAL